MVALLKKKSIQLGELTNTYVIMYQVITSIQVSTVIFTLKVENTTKLPRFTIVVQGHQFCLKMADTKPNPCIVKWNLFTCYLNSPPFECAMINLLITIHIPGQWQSHSPSVEAVPDNNVAFSANILTKQWIVLCTDVTSARVTVLSAHIVPTSQYAVR